MHRNVGGNETLLKFLQNLVLDYTTWCGVSFLTQEVSYPDWRLEVDVFSLQLLHIISAEKLLSMLFGRVSA